MIVIPHIRPPADTHSHTGREANQVASDLLPHAGGGGRGQETKYHSDTKAPSNSLVEGFKLILLPWAL